MENHYEILKVPANAEEEQIRQALRRLRSRYRQLAGSPVKDQARKAEIMMEKLAEVEKTLLDAEKRHQYDAALETGIKLSPSSPDSSNISVKQDWIAIAKQYLEEGNAGRANSAAKEACREMPNNSEAWHIRASSAYELEDYQEADFAAAEAVRISPENTDYLEVLADIAEAQGRYQDAYDIFSKAQTLEPNSYYWPGRIAWLLSDVGKYDDALAQATQLYQTFPEEPYVRDLYGAMLLEQIETLLTEREGILFYSEKKQVSDAEGILNLVQEVEVVDEEILEKLRYHVNLLQNSKARKFFWPGFMGMLLYVLLFVFIIMPFVEFLCVHFLGSSVSKVVTPLLWILIIYLWVSSVLFPYQWQINRRSMGGELQAEAS